MAMINRNAQWWDGECEYIETQINLATQGSTSATFNHDPECLARYCEMQAATAMREGFGDHAERINNASAGRVEP